MDEQKSTKGADTSESEDYMVNAEKIFKVKSFLETDNISSVMPFTVKACSFIDLQNKILKHLGEDSEKGVKTSGTSSPSIGDLKLYNIDGFLLFEDHFEFLQNNDLVYVCLINQDFPIAYYLKEYQIIKEIGQGGFAKVFLGEHKETGDQRAIKCINLGNCQTASETSSMYKEAQSLQRLNHLNIIKLHTVFCLKQTLVLFMEYASGGELYTFVEQKEKENKKITEDEIRPIFIQLIKALSYCHSKKIVHRDIKLENILFADQEKKKIKIIDFGISGKFNEQSKAGTVRYSPPELVSGRNFENDPRIDIWAMGVILYRCLVGSYPFAGESKGEIIENIIYKRIGFSTDCHLSNACKALILRLLEKNSKKRIKMFELMTHPWVLNQPLFPDIGDLKSHNERLVHQKSLDPRERRNKLISDLNNSFCEIDRIPEQSERSSAELVAAKNGNANPLPPGFKIIYDRRKKKGGSSDFKVVEHLSIDSHYDLDFKRIEDKIKANFLSRRNNNKLQISVDMKSSKYSPQNEKDHLHCNSPRKVITKTFDGTKTPQTKSFYQNGSNPPQSSLHLKFRRKGSPVCKTPVRGRHTPKTPLSIHNSICLTKHPTASKNNFLNMNQYNNSTTEEPSDTISKYSNMLNAKQKRTLDKNLKNMMPRLNIHSPGAEKIENRLLLTHAGLPPLGFENTPRNAPVIPTSVSPKNGTGHPHRSLSYAKHNGIINIPKIAVSRNDHIDDIDKSNSNSLQSFPFINRQPLVPHYREGSRNKFNLRMNYSKC